MKLNEITETKEPLLLAIMRKLKEKGEKIAWYIRRGEKSVPVWIHDWHQMMKTYEDGPKPVWTLRGYQGYNVQYRHIRADRADEDYTIVPGKKKGTYQLMHVDRMVKEGVGEAVLTFMDYVQDPAIFNAKRSVAFQELGSQLFKRGFVFSIASNGGGKFDGGNFVIAMPSPNAKPNFKDRVMISHYEKRDGSPASEHASANVFDIIDDGDLEHAFKEIAGKNYL